MTYSKQAEWQKENMKQIKVSYKTEFVEEFKKACNVLDRPQSVILKDKMEETIMKAEKLTNYIDSLIAKYEKAVKELCEYSFGEYEYDVFFNNIRHNYINEITGTDHKTLYLWYVDEYANVAVNLETAELLTEEEDIQKYVMPY